MILILVERSGQAPPADSAMIRQLQNGVCIADDMARAPNFVRWTKADKSPGSRKNGWEIMRKMLKQARREMSC